MTTLGELLQAAVALHNEGKLDEAERIYWTIQEHRPDEPHSLHLLGLIAHQVGRNDAALPLLDKAIAVDSSHAVFHQHRGLVLAALNRKTEARAAFEHALAMAPLDADTHCNFANLLMDLGEVDAALAHRETALRIAPDNHLFLHNLGSTLERLARSGEALDAYRRARSLNPAFVEAWNGEGEVLRKSGYLDAAVEAFQRALAIKPQSPDVLNNIALAFKSKGMPHEALTMLERCLQVAPEHAPAWNNIGTTRQMLGRLDQAAEAFRRSVAIDRRQHVAHSNLLFVQSYMETASGPALRDEAYRWNNRQLHVSGGVGARPAPIVDPDPDRILKVGFISADFRDHAVSYFLLPLFEALDPSRIALFAYSEAQIPDPTTERFRQLVPHWRETRGIHDAALDELIRTDGIDILVDCSGHTAGGRLPVFLRRPAPVQVTTLLGHGGTTGCEGMDYVITDPILTPPELDDHFSEHVIRTTGFFGPFAPRPDWPSVHPAVPEEKVFACVGEPIRIGRPMVALWRQLLDRVPDSRIILKNKAYGDPQERHWRSYFAALGDRVTFEGVPGGWNANMDFYSRVRVVLDTFPATGATSTAIPLWMGVPVLTKAGTHSVQRFGVSILGHVGLRDLAPEADQDYVLRGAALIEDDARLLQLRRDLRTTMRNTICDAGAIARDWERAFRDMWRERLRGPV